MKRLIAILILYFSSLSMTWALEPADQDIKNAMVDIVKYGVHHDSALWYKEKGSFIYPAQYQKTKKPKNKNDLSADRVNQQIKPRYFECN